MICCDECDEWFHGHCVGVTKAMSKSIALYFSPSIFLLMKVAIPCIFFTGVRVPEWTCPICLGEKPDVKKPVSPKGAKSGRKGSVSDSSTAKPVSVSSSKTKQLSIKALLPPTKQLEPSDSREPLSPSKSVKFSKDLVSKSGGKTPSKAVSFKDLSKSSKESSVSEKSSSYDKEAKSSTKESSLKSLKEAGIKHPVTKSKTPKEPSQKESASSAPTTKPLQPGQTACFKCRKAPARSGQLYCSDSCIKFYAEETLQSMTKSGEQSKEDQRIPVIEKKTGRIFAGSNAPLAVNLTKWLLENPTFEVGAVAATSGAPHRSGHVSSKKTKLGKRPTSTSALKAHQAALEQQHNLEQSKAAAVNAEIPSKIVSWFYLLHFLASCNLK